MALNLQFSVAARTARATAIRTTIGTSPILTIRSGTQPATCATANSGTVLATITLASTWSSETSGVLTFSNVPLTDTSADNTGTAAHWRLHDSTGTTCGAQGTVGTISGFDMIVDNTSFVATQSFSITSWTITEGNA